jgi:ATP-dependent RNA helicase DHX36
MTNNLFLLFFFLFFNSLSTARRISAISIAERVAQEQCLNDGANGMGAGLIGYQVRLESAVTKDTQLVFLTPGILLRKLQSSPTLAEFTHIIIDEIHERDRYTEFLLITLRDLLPRRPDLRLILMSATLQTEALVGYFGGYNHSFYEQHPPSIIEMQGRTFPVQEFFLEDVLTMTGYIDAVPSTEDTNLTMDDLEKELAKLMATTDAASTITVDASSSLVCAMCGQTGFSNPAELGSHVAMCDGVAPQRQTASKKLETIESMNDDDENDDDDGGDEINMDAFDDYDVDGVAEVEGYDLLDVQDVQAQEMVESSSTRVKWDGESPYDVSNDDADMKGLTLTEEQLLDQYQMMHDDNQVDTSLLLEVLLHIIKSSSGDGAILVFLPGWMEISEFSMMLESTLPFRDRSKYLVLPLHSGIPSRDQRKVLQRPPSGMRKIVLSTNIAETSLTIEDVSFVVDTGRAKEKNYDPHLKTSTLQPTWISQASSKQRKGRAGRTKAGVCFHLFSSRRHSSFRPFVESELLRTPLVRILRIYDHLVFSHWNRILYSRLSF